MLHILHYTYYIQRIHHPFHRIHYIRYISLHSVHHIQKRIHLPCNQSTAHHKGNITLMLFIMWKILPLLLVIYITAIPILLRWIHLSQRWIIFITHHIHSECYPPDSGGGGISFTIINSLTFNILTCKACAYTESVLSWYPTCISQLYFINQLFFTDYSPLYET